MLRILPVALLAVFALAACDQPTEPLMDVPLEFGVAGNGQGQGALVTGSGHIFQSTMNRFPEDVNIGAEELLRKFSVSVTQGPDGVRGKMHLGSVGRRPGLSFHGTVTCATVVKNPDGTADIWIGGTNDFSNFNLGDLGATFGVRLRDGGDVESDRVSGVFFDGLVNSFEDGDAEFVFCNFHPGVGTGAIDNGNIKAH